MQCKCSVTTAWKEFTAPDGRKYYYNKATKVRGELTGSLPDQHESKTAGSWSRSRAEHLLPEASISTSACVVSFEHTPTHT